MEEISSILEDHKRFTKERNWDDFQTPRNLAMALSVEVSELVEIFMWLNEEKASNLSSTQKMDASEEIADVFLYLLRLSDVLKIDLLKCTYDKMAKNIAKHPIEKSIEAARRLIE